MTIRLSNSIAVFSVFTSVLWLASFSFGDREGPMDLEEAREFWSFVPLGDQQPPEVKNKSWAKGAVDKFTLKKIEDAGREPTPEADRRMLVRRAYLDLHGLPPTTEQTMAFVRDDAPDAWARLIDSLLSSPRYGERWGRHWLDVARYADTNGMDENIGHPDAYRYRDWVIASFNADKPFDQFIVEQIAGDLLPSENLAQRREQTEGAGFLSVGPKMLACDDPDKMRRDIVDEQIDTTGRAFMGLTLGCARCHDHKYDPISIDDYYGLAGIFMSTRTLTKYSVVADFHKHDLSDPKFQDRRTKIAELEKKKSAKGISDEEKNKLGAEIAELKKDLPPKHFVMAPGEYPAKDAKVHLRGDYTTLGKVVPRRMPSVFGQKQQPMPADQSGRLQLARWISSSENPLTARVIVNRIWRWHFGRGIVPTPDNFGKLGELPTHPELLDYLARRLIESGWSIKALHREIMLSATYRQSSRASKELVYADPDNKLFARWQRRRVESEVVRDSILFKSNRLDLNSNGPRLVVKGDRYAQGDKKPEYEKSACRTVYLPVFRSSGYEDQNAFDFADPAVIEGNRRTSTVTTQALFLMNSSMVHQSSAVLADLMLKATEGNSHRERTNWMVLHLYGREATDAELKRGESFISGYSEGSEKDGWAAFARALFASNEFLYIE